MLTISWSLEYHVPWSLFAKYHKTPAPTKGTVYRANLYKCADQTSHPHWVSTLPQLSTGDSSPHKPTLNNRHNPRPPILRFQS